MARKLALALFAAATFLLPACAVKREPRVLISPSFSSAHAEATTEAPSRPAVAVAEPR